MPEDTLVERYDGDLAPEVQERFDLSVLGGAKVVRLPGGGVRLPATPTRTGVFKYRRADGSIRREYRPADEVFAPASLATYRDAPVVVGHPAMVREDTRATLAIGHVSGDARQDADHVAADLAVTQPEAVARVDRGDLAELSCGYTCRTDENPGTSPEGEKYDAIQRDIRINHIGLGPRGWARGGRSLAFRADGPEPLAFRADGWYSGLEEFPQMKIKFDGKEYEAGSPELQAAIDAYKARLDGRLEEVTKERDRIDGQLTAAKSDAGKILADIAKERTDSASKFDAAVTERVELIARARKVLPDLAVRTDGATPAVKDNLAIMTEVVQKAYPKVKLDGRSADYVSALFDQAVEAGRADGIGKFPEALEAVRQDAKPTTPKAPPAAPRAALTREDLR